MECNKCTLDFAVFSANGTAMTEKITTSVNSGLQEKNFIPGTKNISHELLVYPKSVFLPPLHIKFNFMKIFVKSLGREGATFLHLRKIILKNKRGTGKIKGFFYWLTN